MGGKPKDKRGHAPGSIEHRFKDKSGNPAGRPRKVVPEPELTHLSAILARVAGTMVPMQVGGVVREASYKEALVQVLANAALKNTRDGFRMLQLIVDREGGSPPPPLASDDRPAEFLDDPIVKRQLERELRRCLRRDGNDGAAAKLMQDQFGSDDEGEAGERDAAADPRAEPEL